MQPAPRFGCRVIDQRGNQAARSLVERPRAVEAGIGRLHLGERPAGKRHLGKLGEGEHACAVAVIDVVIVVGDVVGKRRKLRFDRSIRVEREILLGAMAEDGLRHRPPRSCGQRAVMLHQPLQGLPGEVEPVEARVFSLKLGDHAQGLGVVVEAAFIPHGGVQRPLPCMAEGGMAEVVGKGERLGQIFVDAERPGHGAGDLRHFEAMGEPGAVMIALVIDEDLRLVGQPAESGRMQDAVAVPGVERARRAWGLGHEAAPALALIHGVRRQGPVGFAATVD